MNTAKYAQEIKSMIDNAVKHGLTPETAGDTFHAIMRRLIMDCPYACSKVAVIDFAKYDPFLRYDKQAEAYFNVVGTYSL